MKLKLLGKCIINSYFVKNKDSSTQVKNTTITIENSSNNIDLTEVKGIGPAYEEKIKDIGIKTAFELAQKDPDYISTNIGVSVEHAEKWIKSAKNLI